MSVIYNKTKDGDICLEGLEIEINNSSINAALELIIVNDYFFIQITFEEGLSTADEILLDDIILKHDCTELNEINNFDDFATVQLNNNLNINLTPSSYTQLDLNNLLIENKPTVVSKNTIDNNILIKHDGLYNISFNGNIEGDVVSCYFQLFILRAGSEIAVNGSEKRIDYTQALPWALYNYGAQYHRMNIDIDLNFILMKDDVLIIKAKKVLNPAPTRYNRNFPQSDAATHAILQKNSILSVTKLSGATGPKGEDGKPIKTELIIKKQGAIKARNVEKLNFVGNVTVTDDGNDQATVTILSNQNQFLIHQIEGADGVKSEPMAFLVDSTRKDKILSIESSAFQFGEHTLSNNDWFIINDANHTHAGFAMPFDGTIIRISGACTNSGGSNIKAYVNSVGHSVLEFDDDDNDEQKKYCTDANISFNKNDLIRLRAEDVDDKTRDAVVTIWVKWEVRN